MLKPQMKATHARAFLGAAKLYDVYILVRRTNFMSLRYIGEPGFVAKRLDCKAKTADLDYLHPQHGVIECAGLVVDATIAGAAAYSKPEKYGSALSEWKGFADTMIRPEVRTLEGQRRLTYIPRGGWYFVDLNPSSKRYGCVKFTSSSLLTAGSYIHGDFDLYGIVPAGAPARNVAVTETRLGLKHARSPEFFDVQHYVNRQIGAPVVLHGAQESYGSSHSEEAIDIFGPDGKVTSSEDAAAINSLYETAFRGRLLFTKGGSVEVVRGMFVTPG
ncbi:MAG: hypothetical protein ACT4SY_01390 [Hyphomicrobiales bacterium]